MIDNKFKLLELLNDLLLHNLSGEKPYRNRFNGFNGELSFSQLYESIRGKKLISGGVFLPCNKKDDSFSNSIYITFSSDNPNSKDYRNIYSRVSKLATRGQFFISYDLSTPFNEWETYQLFDSSDGVFLFPVPKFNVYRYVIEDDDFTLVGIQDVQALFKLQGRPLKRGAIEKDVVDSFITKFIQFDEKYLLELYVDRLFFDGYFGWSYFRGAPLDIDFIACNGNEIFFLEIKEKDLSKNNCFGMDQRRIVNSDILERESGCISIYIVREVWEQNKRDFKAWHWIYMSEFHVQAFNRNAVEGGVGMRQSNTNNSTRLCSFDYFKPLLKINSGLKE
jgi:hypothetical protein